MQEGSWWISAKIYELYVDKFAGDFKGLTRHLDHFEHLGVNALHLLPFYPSPMVDDGYDVSDYRGVRAELGTLEDFAAFVEAAHARGIKVMIDLVTNHTSSQHHWFITAHASKHNSKRDYYIWSETGNELKNAINAFPDFKPSNWVWNEATKDYYYATFYPEQPDLNWDNPNVLKEILMRISFWADKGVDGFRLDAIPFLVEREGTTSVGLPETHHIIKHIRRHLDEKHGGNIALLAEVGDSAEAARAYFGDGDECHMIYHFPLAAKMLLALARRDRRIVEEETRLLLDVPFPCRWALFLRNHDEISMVGLSEDERVELLDFLDPERRYAFSKGTTAAMRLGSIFAREPEQLLEAFEFLYSQPGVPIMYYGDEIGMQNLPLQEGIKDTRRYVRGNFDWGTAEKMLADPNSLLNKTAGIIRRNSKTS
ncbi:MAG: Trehalose synthase [Candidatus Adlerbacteria bacterium GW2011_GWC1_50_9]|uniref:Trehalose synthase n=1 Tax=Candidatus Adlerbacteria bacterium GW2011_GWC1_50_9 TaxID=1618608 RepID=A0A0G1WJN2_9BACT|nr:MAG: Trehalose synthase [Candidatus Adlerbacteria bacterium GW2011_GWC1_50_9]